MDWLSTIEQIFACDLPFLSQIPLIRAILGFALVFFIPGFAWTLVIFRQINLFERFVLSFGLSIALVTVNIFALNVFFNVKITGLNSLMIIFVITIIPIVIYLFNRVWRSKSRNSQPNL